MFATLLQCLVHHPLPSAAVPDGGASTTFAGTELLWRRVAHRLRTRIGDSMALQRVAQARQAFQLSLSDIATHPQAALLLDRIARSCSLLELWHLRPEVFNLVALCRDQHEAQRRLAVLNRHYQCRSARSGVIPLSD